MKNKINNHMKYHIPNDAMWRAVFPFLVAESTIAPRLSSSETTLTWPSLEAKCKAFNPFWKKNKTIIL